MPVEIFICYAHEDEKLLNRLKAHLRPLQREGLIDIWHDRYISAGAEWEHEINQHLNKAEITLLLVSTDFMNTDYCYSVEMKQALKRHQAGETCVIPIILCPCDWYVAPFARLQVLPTGGRPVTTWRNRQDAFKNIGLGIRGLVLQLAHEKIVETLDKKLGRSPNYTDDLVLFPEWSKEKRIGKVEEDFSLKGIIDDPANALKDMLKEFFSLARYQGNVDEFLHMISLKVMSECSAAIPPEILEPYIQQMAQGIQVEHFWDIFLPIFNQYVSPEQFWETFNRVLSRSFSELFSALLPSLDDEQKRQYKIFTDRLDLLAIQFSDQNIFNS